MTTEFSKTSNFNFAEYYKVLGVWGIETQWQ